MDERCRWRRSRAVAAQGTREERRFGNAVRLGRTGLTDGCGRVSRIDLLREGKMGEGGVKGKLRGGRGSMGRHDPFSTKVYAVFVAREALPREVGVEKNAYLCVQISRQAR